jgi:hypothetical protein
MLIKDNNIEDDNMLIKAVPQKGHDVCNGIRACH